MSYFSKLTDAHTCYKAFDIKVFKQLDLKRMILLFVQRSQLLFQRKILRYLKYQSDTL